VESGLGLLDDELGNVGDEELSSRELAVAPGTRRETIAHAVATFVIAKSSEGTARSTCQLYGKRLTTLTKFMRSAGITAMDELTPDHLRAFIAWLRETGKHNEGGVHQFYRTMRTWLKWYWDQYDIEERNPIDKVKAPPLPEKLLPPVELDTVQALLRANEQIPNEARRARNKAVLLTLLDSGVRAGELCGFDMGDLDEATGTLTVRRSKTKKARQVFLSQKASRAVRAWLRHHPLKAQALFCSLPYGQRLSYSGLRRIIERLAWRAKVPAPPIHSFRRAMATEFLRDGGSVVDLQRLLGHAGLGLILRYASRTTDDLRASHHAHSPGDKV
jgi:site-specific recombinase XerD